MNVTALAPLVAFSLFALGGNGCSSGGAGDNDGAGGEAEAGEATTSVSLGDPSQALPADNQYGDTMPHPTVTLSTTLGDIRIELFPEDAPVSVENFLGYVASGYYDGLIFHRVIPGFVVQAGGHGPDMALKKTTQPPITNESDNGLRNLRGTLSMARRPDPHSATSQFFISLQDNANLDHRDVLTHQDTDRSEDSAYEGGWGYAVFGRVIEGMDVVDQIATKPRGTVSGQGDVPVEPIVIRSATRGEDIEPAAADSSSAG